MSRPSTTRSMLQQPGRGVVGDRRGAGRGRRRRRDLLVAAERRRQRRHARAEVRAHGRRVGGVVDRVGAARARELAVVERLAVRQREDVRAAAAVDGDRHADRVVGHRQALRGVVAEVDREAVRWMREGRRIERPGGASHLRHRRRVAGVVLEDGQVVAVRLRDVDDEVRGRPAQDERLRVRGAGKRAERDEPAHDGGDAPSHGRHANPRARRLNHRARPCPRARARAARRPARPRRASAHPARPPRRRRCAPPPRAPR